MRVLIFDIETGGNEHAEKYVKPFDKNNPDHVKYGNTKDPDKRAEIERQAYAIYMSQAKDMFGLSAITGKVLAIGYCLIDEDGNERKWNEYLQPGVTEKELVSNFWQHVADLAVQKGLLVGYNSKRFDIPFLVQRSWILFTPTYPLMEGRWYKHWVIDLYEIVTLGLGAQNYKFISYSLKSLAEVFSIGTKETDGKRFEKMFYEERDKAITYLDNDIELTTKLYDRIKDFIRIKENNNEGKSIEDL